MEKTLFSEVNYEIYLAFNKYGFNYIDHTYINIFRWLWNEKHIHPNIDTFPLDKENRSIVKIFNNNSKDTKVFYTKSYDEAIIKIVEYIAINIIEFF